jgi:hypothetical protein
VVLQQHLTRVQSALGGQRRDPDRTSLCICSPDHSGNTPHFFFLFQCLRYAGGDKPNVSTTTPLAQLGGPKRKHDELTLWPGALRNPELLDHVVLSTIGMRHISLAPRPQVPPPGPEALDLGSLWLS